MPLETKANAPKLAKYFHFFLKIIKLALDRCVGLRCTGPYQFAHDRSNDTRFHVGGLFEPKWPSRFPPFLAAKL
jgi:hypothetical protein